MTIFCQSCGSAVLIAHRMLTKRQSEVLAFLRSFIAEHGYAPSFEEIAHEFGYSTLATVHEHLVNLERKGAIARQYNESRAIVILDGAEQKCA